MHSRLSVLVVLILVNLTVPSSRAEESKPPTPPQTVPALQTIKDPVIFCASCDRPFGGDGHKGAMKDLVSNAFVAELRRALYYQDSVHQFESKAHFDNCDFDSAIAYVDNLLEEADGHVKAALNAGKDAKAKEAAVKKAFFAIGQGLHTVQDFYAHSNYIELTKDATKDSLGFPVVAVWTDAGKALTQKLRSSGLVSGFVFWGFSQKCPSGSKSHGDLAKDSESTTSGKVRVAHLENFSHYQLALFTARRASADFLRYTLKRWPLLEEMNGKYLAFEVLVDRRGL